MYKFILFAILATVACINAYSDPNDVNAVVLKLKNDVNPDGTYAYAYDTSNGISAQEDGDGGHYARGGYAFRTPEGETVQVSFIADENGYQPSGTHIPTPPPIPYAILRSLEYIRTHPQSKYQQYQN